MLPSDRKYATRAFGVAVLLFAIAFAISAASDEGGVHFGIRLARALPLAPLCAAISVFLTLGSARAKVDALTLEAIGRAPFFNNAGAVCGGAIFALAAAAVVGLSSKIDIEAIFPSFSSGPHIAWDGAGFIDSDRGVSFDAQGDVTPNVARPANSEAPAAGAPHQRGAASLSLCFAAIAFPLFAAAATRRISSYVLLAIAAAALFTFLAFDAVASGRAPAIVVAMPQAALLFFAVVEYRRSGWLVPS
ncbi:MAG: hypothetical protein ABI461_01500 [Polyangiaceae bacterium]